MTLLRLMRVTSTVRLLVVALILAVISYGVLQSLTSRVSSGAGAENGPFVVALLPLLLFVFPLSRRATPFELALPLSTKTLFDARLCRTLLCIWVPIGVVAGLLASGGRADGAWMSLAVKTGLVFTLAAAVLQSIGTRVAQLSWQIISIILVIAVAALVFVETHGSDGLVLSGCLVGSLAVYGLTRAGLPLTFEVAGREGREQESRTVVAAAHSRLPWRPALRAFAPWNAWLMMAAVVLQSLAGDWMISALWAWIMATQFRPNHDYLTSLPISRRALLWGRLAPALLLTFESQAIGTYMHPARQPIAFEEGELKVPLTLFRAEPGPGRVQAPWGEVCEPRAERIWMISAYSPFGTCSTSSARFVKWQANRAWEEVRRRRGPVSRVRELGGALFLTAAGLLLGLLVLQLPSLHRRSGMQPKGRGLFAIVLLLLFLAFFGVTVFSNLGAKPFTGTIEHAALLWMVEQMPRNLWLSSLFCGAILAGLYGLLDAQTQRLDIYRALAQLRDG